METKMKVSIARDMTIFFTVEGPYFYNCCITCV